MIKLKSLSVESMKEMEREQVKRPLLDKPEEDVASHADLTPLSTYLASKSAEVTYRQYMASPRSSLFAGKMVAKIMYGETVTWEQLKEVYRTLPLF